MFDLGADKLLLVGLLVGIIAGPERLVTWARTAASQLGRFRQAYQDGRNRVRDELNELAPDWRDLDPRKVDPRRIIRDALVATPPPRDTRSTSAPAVEPPPVVGGSAPAPRAADE